MADAGKDQILNFVVTQLETNCYAYVSEIIELYIKDR